MSLITDLTDLLLDQVEWGAGPVSERGLVATFSAASIALTVVTVWFLVTFPDSINRPTWGLVVLAGAVLCGAGGVLVSFLHVRRNESDRLFGLLSLVINLAAVATPLLWTMLAD